MKMLTPKVFISKLHLYLTSFLVAVGFYNLTYIYSIWQASFSM